MKKLLVLWMMLCLAVCIGPLFADTAEGYSNTFNINNTVGNERRKPPQAVARSPYTGEANQLRGQLHDHSIPDSWSRYDDTGATPEDNVRKYRDEYGYDFLALTNHHEHGLSPSSVSLPAGSDPWSGWIPRSVELTYGGPGSGRDGHVLAVGLAPGTAVGDLLYDSRAGSEPNDVVDNLVHRIRNVHDNFGLAFVAHPNAKVLGWDYRVTVEELLQICRQGRPDAISVWQSLSEAEAKWDEVLAKFGDAVWGYSEDDYHPDWLSNDFIGTTWISVPWPEGTDVWWDGLGGLKERLANGNYYIAWTAGPRWDLGSAPRMHVSVNNSGTYPVLTANVDNLGSWTSTLHFKVYDGESYSYYPGPEYACTGYERYVTVQADVNWGWGRRIYMRSQPIWIDPVDSGILSASAAGRAIAGAGSPELLLAYLGATEKPMAPPTGYVGHAYDVTTDDGQLPPDATLELCYDGEDISAVGGTQYLAIYRYDTGTSAWVKVGGTVDYGTATITTPITALGCYTISADLPVDTTPSEVFFDNPPYGGIVNHDAQVKVTVNDDLGPYVVRFTMNDHLLAEDTNAIDGWSVNLPYADYCTGDWTLKAVAEDLAGNRGEAEIPIYVNSTTPRPTVEITSPTAGANLTGTATVTGTCGDNVGVATVALYADDTFLGYAIPNETGTAWTAEVNTSYLADGPRTLKAVVHDYPGNEATDTVSVNLNNGETSIGSLRGTADGQFVRTAPAIVTAATTDMGGAYFYIESADRSAGIRVATDKVVLEGAQVLVAGVIGTSNGERQITASDVFVALEPGQLPDPLGTVGTSFKVGLDNTGLLVRVWGKITAAPEGSGYFYVNDGSSLNDGSGSIGIKVYGTPPADPVGKRVSVTGISGAELSGETPIPVIRTRRAADVAEVSGL